MKNKIVILYLILILPCISYTQTVDDISKIAIGVYFENGTSQETIKLRSLLEDKLVKFATQAGYSSFNNTSFFISPNIVVNSVDVAEGGMKNVYIVRGELYLTIQDKSTNIVFSSGSYLFKGTATNKDLAIKNGILNIIYENINSLFIEAKSKILSYYESRKELIFTRANMLVADGDYDGAIACLMMIPEDLTELYKEALIKAQDIYEMRDDAIRLQIIAKQKHNNDSILMTANSYLSMHEPRAALNILSKYTSGDTQQDITYREYVSRAENMISAIEREEKRKEERTYQDNKRREERNYQDNRRKEERRYQEYSEQMAHQREMDRQNMALRNQVISASERVTHHKLRIEEQKVNALKQVACDYIKNNPNNIDYIRVKF